MALNHEVMRVGIDDLNHDIVMSSNDRMIGIKDPNHSKPWHINYQDDNETVRIGVMASIIYMKLLKN